MSKIALAGAVSGTATFTIESPATSTNRTLTLPDNTGTILTNATTTGFPAGSVIQVVQNSSTVSTTNTTSTTYVDLTNATATITPSSASNKILVLWTSSGSNAIVASTNVIYYQNVVRTSTQLAETLLAAESGGGGLQVKGTMAFSILDAPNTTSAVTYKIQHRTSNASSTGTASNGFLTLMEIAG